MSTIKVSSEEFKNSFDELVNKIWSIQERIGELEEFERQWLMVFEKLKVLTGDENVKVGIKSRSIYQNYFWDKYRLLVIDLLSLLSNEKMNERSVVRQVIYHCAAFSRVG